MSKQQQIEDLYAEMKGCRKCERLTKMRTQVVGPRGDADRARILYLGEAPGPEEDEDGVSFVGKSGQKLDEMLAKLAGPEGVGASAEDFFVWNVLSCFPHSLNPLNGKKEIAKPTSVELENCRPFVERAVRIIDPAFIVLAGEYACSSFGIRGAISNVRGRPVDVVVQGIDRPIAYCAMPVFHPAYLLRTADKPMLQELTEKDMRAVVDRVWAYLRVSQGMSPVPA